MTAHHSQRAANYDFIIGAIHNTAFNGDSENSIVGTLEQTRGVWRHVEAQNSPGSPNMTQ